MELLPWQLASIAKGLIALFDPRSGSRVRSKDSPEFRYSRPTVQRDASACALGTIGHSVSSS